MSTLPVPTETDATIQSASTGAVDYLQFTGTTLTGSDMQNYGLSSAFHVVASGDFNGDGNPDLVAQNAAGQVDIVNLNVSAQLISTTLVATALPPIVGSGDFDPTLDTSGDPPTLVSQLSNGSLDMLQLNTTGVFVASDLVPNTAGLPQAVGVGESLNFFPMFANPATNTDSVATQLANGAVDLIGFNGTFGIHTPAGSLSYAASDLTGTAGLGPVGDVNPDFTFDNIGHENVGTTSTAPEGNLFITTAASGQLDAAYTDSGYNSTTQGVQYASELFNFSQPGWNVVSGGAVTSALFPVS